MEDNTLTKYNTAARICGEVYREVLGKIDKGESNVKELCEWGTTTLGERISNVYKKEKVKGIAYPLTISKNDCVGDYYYDDSDYNTLNDGDTIKIQLGAKIGDTIAMLCETTSVRSQGDEYMSVLELMSKCVVANLQSGVTNDDIRIQLEEICTNSDCFPLENTVSYQHLEGLPKTEESKYLVLNHRKLYDDDDNLCVEPNLCFEFDEGEVYTFDICIVPNDNKTFDADTMHFREEEAQIGRLNGYHHSLKLNASRTFYSKAANERGTGAFYTSHYTTPKDKMGIKECVDKGIMDLYPLMFHKRGLRVYRKMFTIVVGKDKCLKLKY
jgi:methionine aminopeptidase